MEYVLRPSFVLGINQTSCSARLPPIEEQEASMVDGRSH